MNALVTEQVLQTPAVVAASANVSRAAPQVRTFQPEGGPTAIQARLFLRQARFAQARAAHRNLVH